MFLLGSSKCVPNPVRRYLLTVSKSLTPGKIKHSLLVKAFWLSLSVIY